LFDKFSAAKKTGGDNSIKQGIVCPVREILFCMLLGLCDQFVYPGTDKLTVVMSFSEGLNLENGKGNWRMVLDSYIECLAGCKCKGL